MSRLKKPAVLMLLLVLFFIADRLLKFLAGGMDTNEINLLGHFLRFGFYPNSRLFFILEMPALLVFGATLVALLLLFIFHQEQKCHNPLPIYFIFAGGISNFYDRAVHGYVNDFFLIFNSLTFNFADMLISAGALMIIIPPLQEHWRAKQSKVSSFRIKEL